MAVQVAYASYTIVDIVDNLNWLGDLPEEPTENVSKGDAYHNTTNNNSYIYNGSDWVILLEGSSMYYIKPINNVSVGVTYDNKFKEVDDDGNYSHFLKPVAHFGNDSLSCGYTIGEDSYEGMETYYLALEVSSSGDYFSASLDDEEGGFLITWMPEDPTNKYTCIISLYKNEDGTHNEVASTTVTFQKVADGQNAVGYDLIISPTQWSKPVKSEATTQVSFQVKKRQGTEITNITTIGGYEIRVGDTLINSLIYTVGKSVTFDLYVNGQLEDSKTFNVSLESTITMEKDDTTGTTTITTTNPDREVKETQISDGKDAYTINVSGENVQIAETEVKALADKATKLLSTMTIEALKGSTAQTITITEISTSSASTNSYTSTSIEGLYYTLSGQDSKKPTISFYCSNTLAADGQIPIEFTVNRQTFTKTFSFAISEQGKQGPQGLPVKDLILSSTATEVQVTLDSGGNYVYSPDSITFTAEPKNLTTGTYTWENNSSTANSLTIEPNESDQNITFPYTAKVTFTETSTGQTYTKSITVTCPRQIISGEQNIQTYTWYAGSDYSYTPPSTYPKNGTNGDNSNNATWVWVTQQIGTSYTYTYSDNSAQKTDPQYTPWSEWKLDVSNVNDIEAFNILTGNGRFEGHFYGVYVWINSTGTNAYFYKVNDCSKYLIIPNDSDIANNALYISNSSGVWDRVNSSELTVQGKDDKTLKDYIDYYVNASMIQTGALEVKNSTGTIFKAGFDGNSVEIAGFHVDEKSLVNITDDGNYVYLGTDAIKLGGDTDNPVFSVDNQGIMQMTKGSIALGGDANNPVFSVDDSGEVQMTKGSIKLGTKTDEHHPFEVNADGEMYSIKGHIGGFTIDSTYLQATNNGYVYLGTDAIKLGTKSGEHHPFEVNDQGELYNVKGNIGGWNINETGLYSSTSEELVYLKRIHYSFAQGESVDQTIEDAVSLTYQSSLINLSSFFPIFVKRTFDYGSFTLNTITKMTIRTQQGYDAQITAYNIYYSNSRDAQLPISTNDPGGFEKWTNWLPTREDLYDYICVDWRASSDGGFDPLVPYDSGSNALSTAGISTLTDYKQKTSAYYFGCNSDENIQNSSLLDDSNSALVFYAGGNILNLQEAAFQVLRDGSVYMKALQVDRLIVEGQELNFGVADTYVGSGVYESGITMYSGDTQLQTKSTYGFYIGFDGANFGQLYLQGKKVNIDSNDGHLYIN